MDELRLTKEQADAFVLSILKENIDCSENIKIITLINEGKISYELEDIMFYKDKAHNRRTSLRFLEYITLLKQALAQKGYGQVFIKPVIRKETIKYIGSFRLLEKPTRLRRKQ